MFLQKTLTSTFSPDRQNLSSSYTLSFGAHTPEHIHAHPHMCTHPQTYTSLRYLLCYRSETPFLVLPTTLTSQPRRKGRNKNGERVYRDWRVCWGCKLHRHEPENSLLGNEKENSSEMNQKTSILCIVKIITVDLVWCFFHPVGLQQSLFVTALLCLEPCHCQDVRPSASITDRGFWSSYSASSITKLSPQDP